MLGIRPAVGIIWRVKCHFFIRVQEDDFKESIFLGESSGFLDVTWSTARDDARTCGCDVAMLWVESRFWTCGLFKSTHGIL